MWHLTAHKNSVSLAFLNWIKNETIFGRVFELMLPTLIQRYDKKSFHFLLKIRITDVFHISNQNIDCGYSLEPPRWGGFNEYPQSMFLIRNKKHNVYPVNLSFTI